MRFAGQIRDLALARLDADVRSPLPTTSQGGELLPLARQVVAERIAEDAVVATTQVLQKTFAAAGLSVGFLTDSALADVGEFLRPSVEDLRGIIGPIVADGVGGLPESIVALLGSPLVGQLVTAIAGPLVAAQVAQAVPVVGWVLALAVNTGQIVSKAVKADRAASLPKFWPPYVFRPADDVEVFQERVMPILRSEAGGMGASPLDWTPMFLPPGGTAGPGGLSPFGRTYFTNGTIAFTPRYPGDIGVIPGSGLLHQGYTTAPAGGPGYDIGAFLPLTQAAGASLWSLQVMQASPALFAVDASALKIWALYLEDFRQYLLGEFPQDDPSAKLPFEDKKQCRAMLGASRCDGYWGEVFGPADVRKCIDFYSDPGRFGWADADGFYRRKDGTRIKADADDPYGVKESTPVRAAAMLQKRQLEALDTLLVAYVDDGFVAIRNDPVVRERWQQRRQQLLTHPDRCRVDLDSVPTVTDGGLYRQALKDAGVGTLECRTVGGFVAAPPLPTLADPPLPDGMPTPHGSGIGVLPVVGAAIGVGWLARRLLRRAR